MNDIDSYTKLRNDTVKLKRKISNQRCCLGPSLLAKKTGDTLYEAEQYLEKARAKLNEAIGWSSDSHE